MGLLRDLTADHRELWETEARALGSLASAPPAPSHARILHPGLDLSTLCPFLFSKEREEGRGRGRANAMKRGTVHGRDRLGFDRRDFII